VHPHHHRRRRTTPINPSPTQTLADKEVYSTSVLGVQVPHPKLGIAKRPNRFDVIVPESQGGLLCFSTPSQDLRSQVW